MPPWRTVDDTRAEGKPVSLTTMASASSAAFLCCTSKSGGTYSASITGVSGSTLTKRIMPPDGPAIINAVATAGLARSGSARSIGTRIFLYMAPSHSLTWFSDILPRLPADRESGAPPMPPSAVAQAPWPRGANGPPPALAPTGQAPRALSDPIGLCQRAGAHEALEPSAVGMQLAPILAGKIDHREAGRRQPLIESLAGLDVARGDQPPRRVMQPRIVSDHQQRAHRRRGLLHERDDRLGAGVVEALLVNDARGLRQRGGDALPRLPGSAFSDLACRSSIKRMAAASMSRAAQVSVVDLKFRPLYQQARMATSNPKPGAPQGFANFAAGTLAWRAMAWPAGEKT